MSVRAALVTVGDELLLGQTVDTNAAWLGRGLAEMGVPVVRRYTVGDVGRDIRTAVAGAMDVADVVLVSGGLGPTPDDITRESVGGLLGRPLTVDTGILEGLRRRYADRGLGDLPDANRAVAMVPEGAVLLDNPHGTAPGLAMDEGETLVILLPGVPRELRGIFDTGVRGLLDRRFGDRLVPVHIRVIRTTSVPESRLAQSIAELLPAGPAPLGLAFLPDLRGVDLRLTARDMPADEAQGALDALEAALDPILAPYRFHARDGDLASALVDTLRGQGKTLATAESCTGGLIGKRVTEIAGASDVYLGGVVAYANAVKEAQLGVRRETLVGDGAVSEAVAREMAEGVATALGADAGVAVTGVAGPGGGTPEKPVGTVWHAATLGGRTVSRLETFPGDRRSVRERAAQAALFLLLRLADGRL